LLQAAPKAHPKKSCHPERPRSASRRIGTVASIRRLMKFNNRHSEKSCHPERSAKHAVEGPAVCSIRAEGASAAFCFVILSEAKDPPQQKWVPHPSALLAEGWADQKHRPRLSSKNKMSSSAKPRSASQRIGTVASIRRLIKSNNRHSEKSCHPERSAKHAVEGPAVCSKPRRRRIRKCFHPERSERLGGPGLISWLTRVPHPSIWDVGSGNYQGLWQSKTKPMSQQQGHRAPIFVRGF